MENAQSSDASHATSDAASRALWKTEILRLQQVIEAITGHRLDDVVRSRITGPLRMRDTGYAPDARRRAPRL